MKVGDLVCVRTLPSYMGVVIAAIDGEPHYRRRIRFTDGGIVEWPERDLKVINAHR